jgi:integral membrane protein
MEKCYTILGVAYFKLAFLEGVSFILLMTIGLYFKYQLNDDSYVKLLGMPHGLLFVIYIIIAYLLREEENWKTKDFIIVLFASVIPFGTFYIDRKYF